MIFGGNPIGTIDVANRCPGPRLVGNNSLRPATGPPPRNSSASVPGGCASTDVAGLPRWIGNAVERGAHAFDEPLGGRSAAPP